MKLNPFPKAPPQRFQLLPKYLEAEGAKYYYPFYFHQAPKHSTKIHFHCGELSSSLIIMLKIRNIKLNTAWKCCSTLK